MQSNIYVNGTAAKLESRETYMRYNLWHGSNGGSNILYLNQNDYLEIYMRGYGDSGSGNVNLNGANSYISIHLVAD